MAKRYEDRYGRGNQRRDRDYADDRGYVDRASDEVRSWFGDDDAERRRHMDEQRDRPRDASYDAYASREDWSRREWPRHDDQRSGDWPRWDYRHTQWDREQRPGGRARNEDWSRTSAAADWDRDRPIGVRGWSDRDTDYGRRTAAPTGPTWSVDDGRSEFRDQRWGKGPKGYQRSDPRIQEEVCDRLTYSNVDAEDIEVSVESGEVTLSGSVRNRWDKRRAEDLVEEVSGVREVHNTIRVARQDRGIGHSESSASDQPGTMLGVNPTAEPGAPRRRP
jgi:osmotically-inducible protein OsmY